MTWLRFLIRFVFIFAAVLLVCIVLDQFFDMGKTLEPLLDLSYSTVYIVISHILNNIPIAFVIALLSINYVWSLGKTDYSSVFQARMNRGVLLLFVFILVGGLGFLLKIGWIPGTYTDSYHKQLHNPSLTAMIPDSISIGSSDREFLNELTTNYQTGDFEKAEQRILYSTPESLRSSVVLHQLWLEIRNSIYTEFKFASTIFKHDALREAYIDYYRGRYVEAAEVFASYAEEMELARYFYAKIQKIQGLHDIEGDIPLADLKVLYEPYTDVLVEPTYLYQYYKELSLFYPSVTHFEQLADSYYKKIKQVSTNDVRGDSHYKHEQGFVWYAESLSIMFTSTSQPKEYEDVLVYMQDVFSNENETVFKHVYLLHPDFNRGVLFVDTGRWDSYGIDFEIIYHISRTESNEEGKQGRIQFGMDLEIIKDFNLILRYYPRWKTDSGLDSFSRAKTENVLPDIFLLKQNMLFGERWAYILFPLLFLIGSLFLRPNLDHRLALPLQLFYTLILTFFIYLVYYIVQQGMKLLYI